MFSWVEAAAGAGPGMENPPGGFFTQNLAERVDNVRHLWKNLGNERN